VNVYSGTLSEITRYLEHHEGENLAADEPCFRRTLSYIARYKPIHPNLRMIEIGPGTGSFPILCKLSGLGCEGLEISPQLVDHARAWGRALGAQPDIRLGNIETTDLGDSVYDVIVASSVFEHVECWRTALANVYRGLKPGGALFFESSSKWSIRASELPALPCYGWLPNRVRYGLQKIIHGPDAMKLGVDFNQFTYRGLRKAFRQVGFSQIHDIFDLMDITNKTGWKLMLIQQARRNSLLRDLVLLFMGATTFVCIK
jgi:SAM-dependent methyltransferase